MSHLPDNACYWGGQKKNKTKGWEKIVQVVEVIEKGVKVENNKVDVVKKIV